MSLTGPQSSGLNYMAASESQRMDFLSDFQQHETDFVWCCWVVLRNEITCFPLDLTIKVASLESPFLTKGRLGSWSYYFQQHEAACLVLDKLGTFVVHLMWTRINPYEEGGYMLCKGRLNLLQNGECFEKNKLFLCKMGNSSIANCWLTLWRIQLCPYNKASITTSKEKGQIFMYYGMTQVEGPSPHKEAGEPTMNEPDRGAPPTQEGCELTRNKLCRGAPPTKKAVSPGGWAVVPLDGNGFFQRMFQNVIDFSDHSFTFQLHSQLTFTWNLAWKSTKNGAWRWLACPT
jgi:hypothetical protein